MYIKLDYETMDFLKNLESITNNDYCIDEDYLINIDDVMVALKDLHHEYELLNEKHKEYQKHVKECYRQKTPYEMEMGDI